ncbi:MAG: BON domain-containing protein [Flavobacterium sp.]|nr:MAG: BON domain-containing protein [Flavobacterium sp.]
MKPNEDLQKDVQDAIKFDPSLHAAEIGVIVHDGVVTLTGTVDNYSKKKAAENAAQNVKGVKAVVESIVVSPKHHPGITDEEIAKGILKAFKSAWDIPDDKISVKVEGSWVWLQGTLAFEYQRNAAKEVASHVPGVKGVINNILLKSEASDKLEKETIERALEHNWAIDATNISVKVDHNKVILSGTVDSLYERSQATRLAWKAPGVVDVENKLVVEFADDIY